MIGDCSCFFKRFGQRWLITADEGEYGTKLNVFDWKEKTLKQKIDLGMDGLMPLEISFLHDPKASEGFVGCAMNANVYR